MGAPAGPAGCSKANDEGGGKSAFQIGAAYGQVWSHLHFEDGYEPTVNQQSVAGFVEYFWTSGYSLHFSGGAVVEGDIKGNGATYPIEPGWLVSVRLEKQLVRERVIIPFISLSLALSFSKLTVTGGDPSSARWLSTDARLGLTVGYTFFDFWQIYVAPKLFGGPIYWERKGDWQRGRDRYFFQAGVGTAFMLPADITIFAYGSPLGEQAISAGAAVSF